MQNISKLIIVVNYSLNKDYIAKNLCVKRDEPGNCCKGKCELKKNLDEAEKKESVPANPAKEKAEVLFFSAADKSNFILFPTLFFIEVRHTPAPDFKSLHSIFHPPRA